MSAVGFDFGNDSCTVAVARQRGINVVLNDESKFETPAVVCFGDLQNYINVAKAAPFVINAKNLFSEIKTLIGRQFSDPELQQDVKLLPYNVIEGPDGYSVILSGASRPYTSTKMFGMALSCLKEIAQKNLNAAVVDCCIGIPVYFTDIQRRAVLDAATMAGLNPLRLIHETTATALAYGINMTHLLPENAQLNVAFVDVGHASMQVCIAGYKRGQLKVLAHSYDRSLGGKEFDEVLFSHFAAKFKDEYNIDVFEDARTILRLRDACEKLKKVLSVNPEAPLYIESLMDKKDVRGFIKCDEFEQLCLPILERVKGPLEKALAEAGLTVKNVHIVEMVGSGCRVPAINKILTEFFKKEPRQTMNPSECVARGCALQCALLGPNIKVREFQVIDSLPFSISLSWKGSGSDAHNSGTYKAKVLLLSTIVFPKGTRIPSSKAMTFYRSGTFSVDLQYGDGIMMQTPTKISTYNIGPFQTKNGEKAKIKLRVRLNLHGIVSVDSATLYEEEKVDVPVSRESTGKKANMYPVEAPPAAAAATPNYNTKIRDPVSKTTDKVVQQMGEEVTTSPGGEREPILAGPFEAGLTNAADVEPVKSLEAVAMEIQEEDLLANLGDLDKAISFTHSVGEKSNSFPAKESIASSTPTSSSGNHYILMPLVRQVRQLLNVQLSVLVTDQCLQKQFSELLQQLDAADKPEALTAQVTLLRKSYNSICVDFPKAWNAFSSHQQLKDSQAMDEKKLESYIDAKIALSASVTKGKTRFAELSDEIQELEHQLTENKETRQVLGIALKKNEANLGKAMDKISKCLQVKEEIQSAMPASIKAAEDAERFYSELGNQLFALKRYFDNFQPLKRSFDNFQH